MIFLLQCTSTLFCLFLISLGCFLKVVANSSILLGRGLKVFVFGLAPISSLCDLALSFFAIVDKYYNQRMKIKKSNMSFPVEKQRFLKNILRSIVITHKIIILKYMQSIFVVRQIVWAKVKGYPWWPAEIAKLPTSDNNLFKVVFIAEDTHAFLNPRDVRKYAEFYDECSKKKMRGLAPAIQNADEVFKKRTQIILKVSNQCSRQEVSPRKSKNKNPAKTKNIKKGANKGQRNKQSESSDQEYAMEQVLQQPQQQRPIMNPTKPTKVKQQAVLPQRNNQEMESQEMEGSSKSDSESESMQQEKFLNQSEQKVDRSKIDTVQELIYKRIQEIKQSNYQFSIDHYRLISINNLTDEELLQSKITNMLSFIIHSLKKQFNLQQNPKEKDNHFAKEKEELRQLIAIQKQLKQRVLNYLNDTSYYDQYLKLIQKNKKNRNDYENRLIFYLKNSYKIKKELALIFASRLMAEINNGTINRQKQLLEDIKERRMEITSINNKAAIDRNIENMIPKYM